MTLTILFRRILFFLILLLGQIGLFAQGTWERISVPTNQDLKSVCFTDSLYGWVAGDSGIILHTINGGKNWVRQESHGINEISDVYFLNRSLGWAASLQYSVEPFGTIMLKTTDGGDNWIASPYPTKDIFISCILFRDSLNGWVGGRPHLIAKTTNGGINWTQASIDSSILAFFPVLSIQFYNDKYGYASGGMFDIAGVTWRTSNGGDKWFAMDASDAPADEIHALYLFDSIHVIGAGGDPDFGYGVGMTRTSDGGLNWEYEELDVQGTARDIDFRNATEAWAPLGNRQLFIYSLDAGNTWTTIPTPDSVAIFDVMFPDSLHGFAAGRQGAVLKYKPRIIPTVTPVPSIVNDFILYQNYPNPCYISTKIKYYLPSTAKYMQLNADLPGSYIQIKVYNLLGDEVATLQNSDISQGQHELEFSPSNLPGGIYFYQLYLVSAKREIALTIPKKMVINW